MIMSMVKNKAPLPMSPGRFGFFHSIRRTSDHLASQNNEYFTQKQTLKQKDLFLIFVSSIFSILLVWLPFFFGFKEGTITLFKNYDGPNYLIIAKSWYDKLYIAKHFSLPIPLEYYAAHLPGYPLTISFLNIFIPGPWAMLLSTLLSTIAASLIFYLFLYKFKLSENPLWLTIVFLVFPARWVAVKAIGSPEPLFIFAILASFYFFKSAFDSAENNLISKKKSIILDLFLAGIFGAIAQITKSPGILLFVGYEICLIKRFSNNFTKLYFNDIYHCIKYSLPLLLIPVAAVGVFVFYYFRTGDFLAYFHSGDNFHLVFPPYQGFFPERTWLGTFWNEDMVWQYLLGALTVVYLIKQKYDDLASFAGVFFTATLFVAHRDLARYSLPLVPFALIAFDKFIQKKEFKIALLIILPAIYLYTINFIGGNVAPVADWTPYL